MINIYDRDVLRKLNSLTKYPSIPTYHRIDGKTGCLYDEVIVPFEPDETVFISEKIDGCNARVIYVPGVDESTPEIFIGSREDFLHHVGDVIWDTTLDIVDVMLEVPNIKNVSTTVLAVRFFEVYGGKKGKTCKQYTSTGLYDARMFDGFQMAEYEDILAKSLHDISLWRQNGGQPFHPVDTIDWIHDKLGIDIVPPIGEIQGRDLPVEIEETLEFLHRMVPQSNASLDDGAQKNAEGVVIRNSDRTKIAKIRFQDYERTIRKWKCV